MIRTHSAWHNVDRSDWTRQERLYRAHLDQVRIYSPELARLAESFTLHDGRALGVQVITSRVRGRDALVTVRASRGEDPCSVFLHVLRFRDVSGGIRVLPSDLDILFFDVEVLGQGVCRLGFALDANRLWSIKFSDFGIYTHEYGKPA